MSNIEEYTEKNFEDIKQIDEHGNEFWEARELQQILGYKAIEELGGTMPEDLPIPKKSIKELEKEELQKIGNN